MMQWPGGKYQPRFFEGFGRGDIAKCTRQVTAITPVRILSESTILAALDEVRLRQKRLKTLS